MSVLSKKFAILFSAAALLSLAGCAKKPIRPDPSETMLGSGGVNGAGYSDALNTQAVDTGDLFASDITDLEQRDGLIYDGNLVRGYFEPVYFDFDQSAIKPSERSKLEFALQYLADNPNDRLLLEGHCDWRGTAEYNLGLGDRRAGAARQFLETAGASSARIETSSKGDLEAVENADADTMAGDRRVDIVIIKP